MAYILIYSCVRPLSVPLRRSLSRSVQRLRRLFRAPTIFRSRTERPKRRVEERSLVVASWRWRVLVFVWQDPHAIVRYSCVYRPTRRQPIHFQAHAGRFPEYAACAHEGACCSRVDISRCVTDVSRHSATGCLRSSTRRNILRRSVSWAVQGSPTTLQLRSGKDWTLQSANVSVGLFLCELAEADGTLVFGLTQESARTTKQWYESTDKSRR
jgi:hypothetical protein